MIIIHQTYVMSDHVTVRTLCGLTMYSDHTATRQAKQSGPWESCPLCETALLLDSLQLPDTPPPRHWIQPPLEGMETT